MHINKYFKLIQEKGQSHRLYLTLCLLRIVLVFIPQFGYIHPDEFFQSVEVMAGDEYSLEHTRTWEFNTTSPIRSIVLPFFLYRIPLNLFRFGNAYARYYLNLNLLNAYSLLILPRLIMVALSFINDWSLYQICKSHSIKYESRLLTLASSYIMLIYASRTFSNTIEMCLASFLLAIVAECMVHTNTSIFQTEFLDDKYKAAKSTVEKVKIYKLKVSVPSHSFSNCFLVANLCVIGVFNRPTFLCFGMPIVFFWLLRGMGTRTISFVDFHMRICLFILCAIPLLLFFIAADSFYYSHLSLSELFRLEISLNNFVVTPLNFIRYNIDPTKTAQHGLHPKYLHILVNIPLLYNVLGIIAVFSFGMMLYRFLYAEYKYLPRAQSIITLMNSSIFVPVILLSLINHQEPRFLLPITIPIIMLHASKLQTGITITNPFTRRNKINEFIYNKILCKKINANFLLKCWYTSNILLTIFYGFLHQAGVVRLNLHLTESAQLLDNNVYTHLVTSHIYKVPMTFFFLPSTKTLITNPNNGQKYQRTKRFFLYEYEEMNMDNLYKSIKLILDLNEVNAFRTKQRHQLLLAIPSSLSNELSLSFWRSNNTLIRYEKIKVFYPHISTEALPKLFEKHPVKINTDVFDVEQKCGLYEDDADDNFPYSLSSWLNKVSSVAHQFGLALYKIDVRRKHS